MAEITEDEKLLADALMSLLKDKKPALKKVLSSITKMQKVSNGIEMLRASLDQNKSEANKEKCLNTALKVIGEQSMIMNDMLLVTLVYMQSSSFSVDVAQLLGKLGQGSEAVRAMFKEKLKGD